MARLFIPGPTDVDENTLEAMQRPLIGHRSTEFAELFGRIQTRLKAVLQTTNRVFITSTSGTGLFEGAMKNMVAERILVCMCGAFGERWLTVAQQNGMNADSVIEDWGKPNLPDQVASQLGTNHYDTLAIVHNETSTGVENPVAEIIQAARQVYPDIIVIVDAVSSAGGVDIRTDELGIDVLVTSSQKCFALPPGLAFAAVSDRAMERANSNSERGYYFDFVLLDKYLQRNMTPSTPSISLFFALDRQLEIILKEGLSQRFQRHIALAERAQDWAEQHFAAFAPQGFRSRTLTTLRNTRDMNIPQLNKYLAGQGMQIGNGYGKLKDKTFRIAHMGELRLNELENLLGHIEAFLSSSEK